MTYEDLTEQESLTDLVLAVKIEDWREKLLVITFLDWKFAQKNKFKFDCDLTAENFYYIKFLRSSNIFVE